MKPIDTVPVFALDADCTWADMENAIAGCVEYQSSRRGRILPLMLFSPMTEPENPDTWEPMKAVPQNLLMVSIERDMDRLMVWAFQQAAATCGELRYAATFPSVCIDFARPLAHVYEQMASAEIQAYALTHGGKDDPSFFFLSSLAAVKAFDREFRKSAQSPRG